MSFFSMSEIERLKYDLSTENVLHILNGQVMYDEFSSKKLMGDASYAPFNEAMCVNKVSMPMFDESFVQLRADGHGDTVENYTKMVVEPLNTLPEKNYECIVLWFGKDMFCQMNLLTMLAYLEQLEYGGKVILHSFDEEDYVVSQMDITLGNYYSVYEDVLIHHQKSLNNIFPMMNRAIDLMLEMQLEDNRVTRYISEHTDIPDYELLQQLFVEFREIGYGDVQYLKLMNR